MSDKDKDLLIEGFKKLDTTNTGIITQRDIYRYLRKNTNLSSKDCQERSKNLITMMDTSNKGEISLQDYVRAKTLSKLKTHLGSNSEMQLKGLEMLDPDHTGKIDKKTLEDELAHAMTENETICVMNSIRHGHKANKHKKHKEKKEKAKAKAKEKEKEKANWKQSQKNKTGKNHKNSDNSNAYAKYTNRKENPATPVPTTGGKVKSRRGSSQIDIDVLQRVGTLQGSLVNLLQNQGASMSTSAESESSSNENEIVNDYDNESDGSRNSLAGFEMVEQNHKVKKKIKTKVKVKAKTKIQIKMKTNAPVNSGSGSSTVSTIKGGNGRPIPVMVPTVSPGLTSGGTRTDLEDNDDTLGDDTTGMMDFGIILEDIDGAMDDETNEIDSQGDIAAAVAATSGNTAGSEQL